MQQRIPRSPQKPYDGYVFDLDGTIYLGEELLPGAQRLILKLRELDRRVVFLSNNPTKSPRTYAEKLTRLGLPTPHNEVVNTVVTMTRWLLQYHPDTTVFPIAEEPLKTALREAGIRISERAEEIDIFRASDDRGFDYRKLQIAFDAIWFHGRAKLVTTNPDRYCPLRARGAAFAMIRVDAGPVGRHAKQAPREVSEACPSPKSRLTARGSPPSPRTL